MATYKKSNESSQVSNFKKSKPPPPPYFISRALYIAIRSTAIYKILDENPDNVLNANSDPIQKSQRNPDGTGNTLFVLYHNTLVRYWLDWLLLSNLWGRDVEIVQEVKSKKSGNVVHGGSKLVKTRCLHIPTENEIRQFFSSSNDEEKIQDALYAARAIKDFLLPTRPGFTHLALREGNSINGETIGAENLTLSKTITATARWESLGHIKIGEYESSQFKLDWEAFYVAENRRFKSLLETSKGSRISDASIRNMTADESVRHCVSAAMNLMMNPAYSRPEYNNEDDRILKKRNAGTAVSIATVFNATHSSTKNVIKKSKPTQDMYKEMIEKYFALTAFRLTLNFERADNTYTFRMGEIEWAENLKALQPETRFGFNRDAGIMMRIKSSELPPSDMFSKYSTKHQETKKETKVVKTSSSKQPNIPYDDNKKEKVVYTGGKFVAAKPLDSSNLTFNRNYGVPKDEDVQSDEQGQEDDDDRGNESDAGNIED